MNTTETLGTQTPSSPVELIVDLALGYLVSRALHVATELGIADQLVEGPKSVDELAIRTGADRASLYRLLRTLASQGVFVEDERARFALTPAGALLQRGVMKDGVLLCGEVTGDGSWWQAVGALRECVITGQPSFELQRRMSCFDYLKHHPECGQWFDRGMANFASAENPAIAQALELARGEHVIDVGGGHGGLLSELLERRPDLTATLFDLPDVIRDAPAQRWTRVAGDFFHSVPTGGDAYVLKRILHDWSDEQCVQILRRCRAAMNDRARLLVVDVVLPPGNAPHPGKVMDILMMVFAHGRERTEHEFRALLDAAGFHLSRIQATTSTLSIVEALPI
jgi:hypothetical protein